MVACSHYFIIRYLDTFSEPKCLDSQSIIVRKIYYYRLLYIIKLGDLCSLEFRFLR